MPIDAAQMLGNVLQAANNLKNMVQAELQKLSEEQEQMAALQSNLNKLRERYYLERSLLSQLTDWYGPKGWFERGQYLLCILAISAIIGVLVSAISSLVVMSASLFCLATYIIDDHFTISSNRDGAFAQDIIVLEEQLKTSIESVNTYDAKIKELFTELFTHNIEVIEYLKTTDNENTFLQEQNKKFASAIAEFERMNQKRFKEDEELIENRSKTTCQFGSIHQKLISIQTDYESYLEGIRESTNQVESAVVSDAAKETDELLARYSKLRQQYTSVSKDGALKSPIDRLSFLNSKMNNEHPLISTVSPIVSGLF